MIASCDRPQANLKSCTTQRINMREAQQHAGHVLYRNKNSGLNRDAFRVIKVSVIHTIINTVMLLLSCHYLFSITPVTVYAQSLIKTTASYLAACSIAAVCKFVTHANSFPVFCGLQSDVEDTSSTPHIWKLNFLAPLLKCTRATFKGALKCASSRENRPLYSCAGRRCTRCIP